MGKAQEKSAIDNFHLVASLASTFLLPIVLVWLQWVSTSIVEIKEQIAFEKGTHAKLSVNTKAPHLGVNIESQFAGMELPFELMLKKAKTSIQ